MSVLRQPQRIVAREDASQFDGVLHTGVVLWSTKMSMERFKMFGSMMREFGEWEEEKWKQTVVRFEPDYDIMRSENGFSEARVAFSSAVDMFRFLGVT